MSRSNWQHTMSRHGLVPFVAIVLLAALPGPAAAQESNFALSGDTRPVLVPGWTFTPSVLYQGVWDDNVLVRGMGDEAPRDFLNILNPKADVTFLGRRGQVDAGYHTLGKEIAHRQGLLSKRIFIDRMGHHLFNKADTRDQLAQFGSRKRDRHVWAKHLTAQRDMHFQNFSAQCRGRQTRIDSARMIGKTYGTPITLAKEREQVQADFFRGTRIGGRALTAHDDAPPLVEEIEDVG